MAFQGNTSTFLQGTFAAMPVPPATLPDRTFYACTDTNQFFYWMGGVPYPIPLPHAASHATGGSDPITAHGIGAATPADVSLAVGKAMQSIPAPAATPTATTTQAGIVQLSVDGGTVATQAVTGSDSRLKNSRSPTSHATSHATGGTDPLTPAAIGALSATDTSVTNARTPTPHKSSHAAGGTDALAPADIAAAPAVHTHAAGDIVSGTIAAARLPAATSTTAGIVQIAAANGTTAGTAVDAADPRNSNARTPSGPAGGSLAGLYPNPSLAPTGVAAGTTGGATVIPAVTVAADGRVIAVNGITIPVVRESRVGSWAIPAILVANVGATLTATIPFATAMPDANFVVMIEQFSATGVAVNVQHKVIGKSATGFTVQYVAAAVLATGAVAFDYVATHY